MSTAHIETRRERQERRDAWKLATVVITFTVTSAVLWWLGRHPFEDVVIGGVSAGVGALVMHSIKRARRERRLRRGLWVD